MIRLNVDENALETGVGLEEIVKKLDDKMHRKLIDNYADKSSSGMILFDFEPDVNKTFNRGFTNYFLNERHKIHNFDTPKFVGENVGKILKVYSNYFTFAGKNLTVQDGLCYFDNDELNVCLEFLPFT